MLLTSCRQEAIAEITIDIEDGKTERIQFAPVSTFAEYFELPGDRHELRVTLASYEASCERYSSPTAGQTLLTLLILTPPGKPLEPGVFAVGKTPPGKRAVEKAVAVPKVLFKDRSYLFRPGGVVKLSNLVLEDHGSVEGLVDGNFAGDAAHPATVIRGSFSGRICRFSPAPES